MLGVPAEDHARFGAWVPDIVAGLDAAAVTSRRVRQRADAAAVAISAYLRELIDRRRADPDDRLLSGLIDAADGDDRLSEDELVAFAALLLIAGHETTANLMGNGLWQLWRHADQFHRWRTEPELRPVASRSCCATTARCSSRSASRSSPSRSAGCTSPAAGS